MQITGILLIYFGYLILIPKANLCSNYKSETMIKKEVYLTSIVVDEIVKIIEDSGIMTLEKDNAGNY